MSNSSNKPVSGEAVDIEALADAPATANAVAADKSDPRVEAARLQAEEDRQWRRDNPGKVLIRGANKDVGGE